MNTIETMRLYLRDQGTEDEIRFSDEDLQALLDQATTIEGATALGWLLTAAESGGDPVSQSVGNTSESWGQPTEKYKVAMRMYNFWDDRDQQNNGTEDNAAGLWLELVPDDADNTGTLVARLIAHQQFIQDYFAVA